MSPVATGVGSSTGENTVADPNRTSTAASIEIASATGTGTGTTVVVVDVVAATVVDDSTSDPPSDDAASSEVGSATDDGSADGESSEPPQATTNATHASCFIARLLWPSDHTLLPSAPLAENRWTERYAPTDTGTSPNRANTPVGRAPRDRLARPAAVEGRLHGALGAACWHEIGMARVGRLGEDAPHHQRVCARAHNECRRQNGPGRRSGAP